MFHCFSIDSPDMCNSYFYKWKIDTFNIYFECSAKYHKLKFGTEPNQEDLKPPQFKDSTGTENTETQQNSKTGLNWRQGRQLLRQ